MRTLWISIPVILATSFLWGLGCGGSNETVFPAPQKSQVLAPHHRVYATLAGSALHREPSDGRAALLRFKNCRWSSLQYLGTAPRMAYLDTDLQRLEGETQKLYLQVDALSAQGKILFRTFLTDPRWIRDPDPGVQVAVCRADLLIDIPDKVNLKEVATLQVRATTGEVVELKGPFDSAEREEAQAPVLEQIKRAREGNRFLAMPLILNAPSDEAFDLVFLGDGLTEDQSPVSSESALRNSYFAKYALAMSKYLFQFEPYAHLKDRINVWIVSTPSKERGADHPSEKIYRDTFYQSTYEANCIRRYVRPKNSLLVYEMAKETPFDQAILLVNDGEHGGSGGTIPAFSLSPYASNTLVHELGHTIGGLADGYYHLSQFRGKSEALVNEEGCKDRRSDVEVYTKNSSANALADDEWGLAPNLTLFKSRDQVKWRQYLRKDSPVVPFEFPNFLPVRGEKSLTFQFTPSADMKRVYLLGGTAGWQSLAISRAREIHVNGEKFGWWRRSKTRMALPKGPGETPIGHLVFTRLKGLSLKKGQKVKLHLVFNSSKEVDDLARLPMNASLVTLVPEVFDPKRIGVFRGAFPSLTKVWRSSYASTMMNQEQVFDWVEQKAIENRLLQFTGTSVLP